MTSDCQVIWGRAEVRVVSTDKWTDSPEEAGGRRSSSETGSDRSRVTTNFRFKTKECNWSHSFSHFCPILLLVTVETIKLRVCFLLGQYLDLFSICHSKDDFEMIKIIWGGEKPHCQHTEILGAPEECSWSAGCRGERYSDGYQRNTDNIRGSRSEGMVAQHQQTCNDAGGGWRFKL